MSIEFVFHFLIMKDDLTHEILLWPFERIDILFITIELNIQMNELLLQ